MPASPVGTDRERYDVTAIAARPGATAANWAPRAARLGGDARVVRERLRPPAHGGTSRSDLTIDMGASGKRGTEHGADRRV